MSAPRRSNSAQKRSMIPARSASGTARHSACAACARASAASICAAEAGVRSATTLPSMGDMDLMLMRYLARDPSFQAAA